MIPKFRAWHKELKVMYEVLAIDFFNKAVTVKFDKEHYRIYSFDDVILMQSTGMVDKNGVEIFEVDIVDAYDYYENLGRKYKTTRFTGVITYEENSFYLKDGEGFFNNRWVNAEEIEIIGNIYENPDLLESVEE